MCASLVSSANKIHKMMLQLKEGHSQKLGTKVNQGYFLEGHQRADQRFGGADHRIQRAWIQGLTGCGVTVAVVDDGK